MVDCSEHFSVDTLVSFGDAIVPVKRNTLPSYNILFLVQACCERACGGIESIYESLRVPISSTGISPSKVSPSKVRHYSFYSDSLSISSLCSDLSSHSFSLLSFLVSHYITPSLISALSHLPSFLHHTCNVGHVFFKELYCEIERKTYFQPSLSLPYVLCNSSNSFGSHSDIAHASLVPLSIYSDAAVWTLVKGKQSHLFREVEAEANITLAETCANIADRLYDVIKKKCIETMCINICHANPSSPTDETMTFGDEAVWQLLLRQLVGRQKHLKSNSSQDMSGVFSLIDSKPFSLLWRTIDAGHSIACAISNLIVCELCGCVVEVGELSLEGDKLTSEESSLVSSDIRKRKRNESRISGGEKGRIGDKEKEEEVDDKRRGSEVEKRKRKRKRKKEEDMLVDGKEGVSSLSSSISILLYTDLLLETEKLLHLTLERSSSRLKRVIPAHMLVVDAARKQVWNDDVGSYVAKKICDGISGLGLSLDPLSVKFVCDPSIIPFPTLVHRQVEDWSDTSIRASSSSSPSLPASFHHTLFLKESHRMTSFQGISLTTFPKFIRTLGLSHTHLFIETLESGLKRMVDNLFVVASGLGRGGKVVSLALSTSLENIGSLCGVLLIADMSGARRKSCNLGPIHSHEADSTSDKGSTHESTKPSMSEAMGSKSSTMPSCSRVESLCTVRDSVFHLRDVIEEELEAIAKEERRRKGENVDIPVTFFIEALVRWKKLPQTMKHCSVPFGVGIMSSIFGSREEVASQCHSLGLNPIDKDVIMACLDLFIE
ncbi:Cytoplasmic FMR1-interacting like protein [Aduncisulcus paluster]|uniref:Cytoplasmic FMR1-interacting like protein n=1 Tax=Aduncisulcus paluster TaxID=2918883 RepID=A0ABQ5KV63_9EUKA|nr:Cytoplasmic FMR1-interacting like protein [Aduncisulcus paluster]